VVGVLVWRSLAESGGGRRAAAERFVMAWVPPNLDYRYTLST